MLKLHLQLFGGRGAGSGGSKQAQAEAEKINEITESLKPTNAKLIENMNEKQLEDEIAKVTSDLEYVNNKMQSVNGGNAENIGLIPMNQLYRGKERLIGRDLQRMTNKSVAFTQLYNNRESLNTRLNALNKAYNSVKGTGMSQKQLAQSKLKNTASTMTWTKAKGQFGNIYKSGDYEIHKVDDATFIYKGGKRISMAKTLKEAKSKVEYLESRKK